MVRSKRVLEMQRCFIDCATAIRIDNVGKPEPYELDEDSIELSGSSTYRNSYAVICEDGQPAQDCRVVRRTEKFYKGEAADVVF